MSLPVLALFERSLRCETRSVLMCLARLALPGMILIGIIPVAAMARYGQLGAPGLRVFQSIIWLDFYFITLAGLSYFASAITEEKEEMTLGLLRMTGLNALAILLGKSSSRLAGAALLLLVQFPFTLLAVTLGGISALQVITAYVTLLAYIFLLCNLALLWSVVCQQTMHAAVLSGVCLGMFLLVPPMGVAMMNSGAMVTALIPNIVRQFGSVCVMLTEASPYKGLEQVLITGANVSPVNVQVLSNLGLGVVLFLVAWALFERCTREQKELAPPREFSLVRSGRSKRVPAHVVGAATVGWKEFYTTLGGIWGQLGLALGFGLVVCAPLIVGEKLTRVYAGDGLMITSVLCFISGTAVLATRLFREEIRWKTLSTLVIIPVSLSEIAYRKVLGCLRGLFPLFVYFALGAFLSPDHLGRFFAHMGDSSTGLMAFLLAVAQYVFFLHLAAYLSLVVKRGALPLAMAIHYFGFIFIALPMGFLFRRSGDAFMPLMWLLTVVLIVVLHGKIGSRLRRAAAEE